jgi:hypothetical protein
MDQPRLFRYQPACSAADCRSPAIYKLAATWSDGTSRELKNYGLACARHCDSQLEAARRRHQALRCSADETVGPVDVYLLQAGCRDAELLPAPRARANSGGEPTGEAGAVG